MTRFQFVADHSDTYQVKRLCELVELERSSYYAWKSAEPARAARVEAEVQLAERIRAIHAEDNTYGAPRITAELNDGASAGGKVNHKRVARVMRENNIVGYRRRRRITTTIPEPADQKVPDLLERDFTADAPNRIYVGDITYLPIGGGANLYLATVIDCYSRKLVGWAIADQCAPSSSPTPFMPPPRLVTGWPGQSFTATTEVNTRQRNSLPSAPASASSSRWARSARVPTTASPNLSTPRSNEKFFRTRTLGPTRRHAGVKCSAGSPATTPEEGTPGADTGPRTPTRARTPLRWRPPRNPPPVSTDWGQGPISGGLPIRSGHVLVLEGVDRVGRRSVFPCDRWRHRVR